MSAPAGHSRPAAATREPLDVHVAPSPGHVCQVRIRFTLGALSTQAALLVADRLCDPIGRVDGEPLAQCLESLGADLRADVDVDHLTLIGSVLADRLEPFLELLVRVLDRRRPEPDWLSAAVLRRLGQTSDALRRAPDLHALVSLNAHAYGSHPYGRSHPSRDDFLSLTPADLEEFWASVLTRTNATIVISGPGSEQVVRAMTESAFSAWTAHGTPLSIPPVRAVTRGIAQVTVRHSPALSPVRLLWRVPGRSDADYPALRLGVVALAGGQSSRAVRSLRARAALAYRVSGSLVHPRAGSVLLLSADVRPGSEEEAVALLLQEVAALGREELSPMEVDRAVSLVVGSHERKLDSAAGRAESLLGLASAGVDPRWEQAHLAAVAEVSAADVRRVMAARVDAAAVCGVVVRGEGTAP